MADQDMFEDQNQQPKSGDPVPTQTDPFADQLKEIKNESGEPKYKDVGTALQALQASQQFIEQLKGEKTRQAQELEQARAELERIGNIEEFVERIAPKPPTPAAPEGTPPANQGLSEDKVAEFIDQRLSKQAQENQRQSNLVSVISQITQTYGEGAREHIAKKAEELNTTPAALKEIAKNNPVMALQLLGGAQPSKPSPSQSTMISARQLQDDNPVPTWEKGAARGGMSNKELVDRWRQVGKYTAKRIGLEN